MATKFRAIANTAQVARHAMSESAKPTLDRAVCLCYVVLQEMKPLAFLAVFLTATLICAEDLEIDLRQFGTPIELPANPTDEKTRPETSLDREIEAFLAQHESYGARLINNSAGRALNKDGRLIGAEAMGRAMNPTEVIIIARASVARPVVELYTSIKKLPDCSESVCIWYTESPDRSKSSLLGYTIENPRGVYTKLVKYSGKTPWLDWITASFKKDGEQDAHQIPDPPLVESLMAIPPSTSKSMPALGQGFGEL